ncbi:MAG: FUSC family protein [Ornithinimicrobium sp.]
MASTTSDRPGSAGNTVRERLGAPAWRRRGKRLRNRLPPIVQAALGASLAWFVANDLLGHAMPFFAPVTAMICLGLTYGNRVRRVIELTVGVAIGVLVGDLFVAFFGVGVWQIAAVCFVAMSLAVVLGAGQLLMLQAGTQGVIVATLVTSEEQAFDRWIDALVGGLVALFITVALPAASPMRRPQEEAASVVAHVAAALGQCALGLRERDLDVVAAALEDSRDLSPEMEDLQEIAAEGLAVARVAPFRRRHRPSVQVVDNLLYPLDLAIRNVRVLIRRAEVALAEGEVVPESYVELLYELALAAQHIADELSEGRTAEEAREDLVNLARRSTWSVRDAGLSAEVMRAQVRSTVVDLLRLTGLPVEEATRRVPPTKADLDPGPHQKSSS